MMVKTAMMAPQWDATPAMGVIGRCVCPRECEPILSACHRSATLCFDACLSPKNTNVLGTSSWHLI